MDPVYSVQFGTGEVPKFKKVLENRILASQEQHLQDGQSDFFQTSQKPVSDYETPTEKLLRQQKERNRIIAEKLSPVAKYKMQEYIRRNRARGVQRRKFSLLMGPPPYRKKNNVLPQILLTQTHKTHSVPHQMVLSQPPNNEMSICTQQHQMMQPLPSQHLQCSAPQASHFSGNNLNNFDAGLELD